MLIDKIVNFCDAEYSSLDGKCGNENGICNHPSGRCSGNCYQCLYQVHFPSRTEEKPKELYDCPKMLYHYVCQYSYLYTTELLYAFDNEKSFIKNCSYYHVLSLGCGGCADLMALDALYCNNKISAPISYIGIDVNMLWEPIHNRIRDYCKATNIKYQVYYSDAFDWLNKYELPDTNIIVISYLLSYLYNTNKIQMIDSLANTLVRHVIMKKDKNPLLIIVNDVNSCYRGRDYFSCFEEAIRNNMLTIKKNEYKYFDDGNLYEAQRIGSPYVPKTFPFTIPAEIQENYHAKSYVNKTIQLLLEVM